MNGKRFVAAYSEKAFVEAKNSARYSDYTFHELGGMNWCVRVGDIDVPFGFGDEGGGYSAYGTVTVSRKNVSAASFDGKGLPYVKEGDIFYLYESEYNGDVYEGFSTFMRDKLTAHVTRIAATSSAEEFEAEVNKLGEIPAVRELLDEHKLKIKSVTVENITKTNK